MGVIVDQFGQPYRGRPEPSELRVRSVRESIRDRDSLGSILTDITPARMLSIFREAEDGMPGRQIELARDLEATDGHLIGLMQIRRLAVTSLEYAIEPGSETDGSQQVADLCRSWWESMDTQGVFERLLDAILQQWAVDRVIWNTAGTFNGGPYWRPVAFEPVDARKLAWPRTDQEAQGEEATITAPRIMREWSIGDTEPIPPGRYLTHCYRAERGRPGVRALVRAVASAWMVKRFAFIDFAALVEQWGKPFISVKYQPGASETVIDELLETLAKSMADRAVGVPLGSEIDVSEGSAHITSLPQEKLMRVCDEIMSKAIIGNTTTTDAAEGNESVSSPTHARVATLIRNADAKSLVATINRDLVAPWFEWNRHLFPADARCPKLDVTLDDPPDPTERGTIYETASRLGLRVKSDQLYSDLRIEKPDDTPEVIELTGSQANNAGLAGLFGEVGNRAPRGTLRPGGPSLPEDPALAGWSRRATEAAVKLADRKFEIAAAWMRGLANSGASLGEIRSRLPELLERIHQEEEEELNRQALLAAELRGRVAAEKAVKDPTDT